jgi:hypothetical protein
MIQSLFFVELIRVVVWLDLDEWIGADRLVFYRRCSTAPVQHPLSAVDSSWWTFTGPWLLLKKTERPESHDTIEFFSMAEGSRGEDTGGHRLVLNKSPKKNILS